MMPQARKKCSQFTNTTIKAGNILELEFADNTFDKVVAGNVIHLLDNPENAMKELERVCKPHGTIIIPTYINIQKSGETSLMVKTLEALGLSFKRQFDFASYKTFFEKMGYTDVEYTIVEGRMPCAVAIIRL